MTNTHHPIHIGIGGWTYAPWRGTFYPSGLRQKDELDYAASRLTAIEINGTYYSSFKPESFKKWADAAPDGFVYSVKASRFCTNRRVLADGADSIAKFLGQGITELGDKLGPILWQFMATKKFDPQDFAGFLTLLPAQQDGIKLRHALEVRHESFNDPAFIEMAGNAGAAIVYADHDEFPLIDATTADFAYARLMKSQADEARGYSDAALDGWAQKKQEWAATRDVYSFFISGAKEHNPLAAIALIERLG